MPSVSTSITDKSLKGRVRGQASSLAT